MKFEKENHLVFSSTHWQTNSYLKIVLFLILFLSSINSVAQVQTGSFVFEGLLRDYFVFLPQSYNGIDKLPVVFNLHGYTLWAEQQMNYSRMNEVADTAGFIVVYPNAVNTTWNSGIYDSPIAPPNPNINDIGFIDALIDTLSKHYSIDPEMIYSCGFSNGGFMSFKLACQLSNRIAAIASVAGMISYTTASECNCNHTMPVLLINGTADGIAPYNGAAGWHSVDYTLNHWINYNLCTESDTISMLDLDPADGCTVQKISYPFCSDSVSVIFYKVINGGHSWPGGDKQHLVLSWGNIGKTNRDINASELIWNFFKNYKLPEPTEVKDYGQIPKEFLLLQNYPNPFNPSTKISVQSPVGSWQTLKIYDVLGREVIILVNEEKAAGTFEVDFDGSGLSSGVYFYQLRAVDPESSSGQVFVDTRKMILLR